MRILLVTNFPAPYRLPLYDELGTKLGEKLFVIYTDIAVEGHRWQIPHLNHPHHFIKLNESVTLIAKKFQPDVVILGGVNKHTLKLFLFAKRKKIKISLFTDMWQLPFSKLSKSSQLLRKLLCKHSDHFIVPGKKSEQHIKEIIPETLASKIHISPFTLQISNFPFNEYGSEGKEFDLLFSGRIDEGKLPSFFVEVASKININRKIKVLVIGDGPLKSDMETALVKKGIDHTFAGYIHQEQLQAYYKKCKVLLFPTIIDTWGIVANEALSVGVPVITSPNAGVADDLIISGKNGFVLENDVELWAQKTIEILNGEHKFVFEAPHRIEMVVEELLKSLKDLVH
ncbi:MAG: glycosyltransferase [Ignavibacteriales bacterium]|nr:glycosyltransferase [Ignavibacteriales bacterium]